MDATLRDEIQQVQQPLRNTKDLDPLLALAADFSYILLGEASHGTHEFYTWRSEISKRLIEEEGFSFIAVEGDWPDCYRVNRYVKGYPNSGKSAYDVLHAFNRWPTWMWANWEIVDLIEWMREFNRNLPEEKKVGFYGLDVYSLFDSLRAVIDFLRQNNPSAVKTALEAALCFEPFKEDAQEYARSLMFVPESCEDEVVDLLKKMQQQQPIFSGDQEAKFNAMQNALVTKNAEKYYRTMMYGGSESWNVRDRHMVETLNRLMQLYGKNARGIVWEHNTHIGDARFTDMAQNGMVNVGQLVREQHSKDGVMLVGFGTYTGSVIAGVEWDAPMRQMRVPSSKPGSWDYLLHLASPKDKLLLFAGRKNELGKKFFEPMSQRAIGVVYNPEFESGNYVPSIIPERYDAYVYIDTTRALSPLHMKQKPDKDLPETYPSAF